MKKVVNPMEVINSSIITPRTRIYCSGNAATPRFLLKYMWEDTSIKDVEMLSVLLLGEIDELFSEETCSRITHRVIFNCPYSRRAVNNGWAKYQLLHLSDIPNKGLVPSRGTRARN